MAAVTKSMQMPNLQQQQAAINSMQNADAKYEDTMQFFKGWREGSTHTAHVTRTRQVMFAHTRRTLHAHAQ